MSIRDVENYKITLKAQKYLNSNASRNTSSYSSNDYSNELPEPEEHDDDDADEAAPLPPAVAAPPKSSQLALPAPPKGMKPGPRTAKLAQQLGKQVHLSYSQSQSCSTRKLGSPGLFIHVSSYPPF